MLASESQIQKEPLSSDALENGNEEEQTTQEHQEIIAPLDPEDVAKLAVQDARSSLRAQFSNASTLPPSYSSISAKEDSLINSDYKSQLSEPNLPLFLPNECLVDKAICTTIKPTNVAYEQLYHYNTCAKFVSDYITFEPRPEGSLCSPTFTLSTRLGNSLDMSVLLASFLIGSGYNAYVVMGKASKSVAEMDFTDLKVEMKDYLPVEFENKLKVNPVMKIENKYKIREIESGFQSKSEVAPELVQNVMHHQYEDKKEGEERPHSWVLLLPGKRKVLEPLFIEPTTGKSYSTNITSYKSIQLLFSHKNIWINSSPIASNLFNLDEGNWKKVCKEDIDFPSWVDAIPLSPQIFADPVSKFIIYQDCKVSVYGDYNRVDGMIQKMEFEKGEYEVKVFERFSNRKDKLYQRLYYKNEVTDKFYGGRINGLKQHMIVDGNTRKMEFYCEARADGLVSRIETQSKTVFMFEDREDRLYYRSVKYEIAKEEEGIIARGKIIKMTEKYHRNPELPEYDDFAKVTFFPKQERIAIVFHLGKGKIVPSTREFRKPHLEMKSQSLNMTSNFVADPFAPKKSLQDIYLQFVRLLDLEQVFLNDIKKYTQELQDIIRLRESEEKEPHLTVSIYDTLRNAQVADGYGLDGEGRAEAKEALKLYQLDYLAPYLIEHENVAALNKEQATQVKDAVLKALKERLVEKAGIIQTRLEEASASLQKRQNEFSSIKSTATEVEKDEYAKFCKDTIFKMNILEKRLAKHKIVAQDKFMQLDNKLKSDSRLAAAYKQAATPKNVPTAATIPAGRRKMSVF